MQGACSQQALRLDKDGSSCDTRLNARPLSVFGHIHTIRKVHRRSSRTRWWHVSEPAAGVIPRRGVAGVAELAQMAAMAAPSNGLMEGSDLPWHMQPPTAKNAHCRRVRLATCVSPLPVWSPAAGPLGAAELTPTAATLPAGTGPGPASGAGAGASPGASASGQGLTGGQKHWMSCVTNAAVPTARAARCSARAPGALDK